MSDAPACPRPGEGRVFVANAHGDLDVVRDAARRGAGARQRGLGLGRRRLGDRRSAPRRTWAGATSRSSCSSAARGSTSSRRRCSARSRSSRAVLAAFPAHARRPRPARDPARRARAGGRRGGARGRSSCSRRARCAHEHVATDLAAGGRGRRRAPLRLGAEGHPAGPPRRARAAPPRRETSVTGQRVLADDPPQRRTSPRTRRTSSARTRGSRSTTAASARAFPLHPARIYEALKRGHRARDGRASAALEHRPHADAREHRARTSATACRSCTGTSSPTGTGSTSSACRRARAPRT